ncbi:hypothetical protein AVEN_103560-1 [Araneus ventricosus]|uniref:Uncharacterized protein n=1 Tax=Araneus ventricosus TaxID=182803 RepID=A0A4Y2G6P4_ARAVE|nr:hypothetical protein AVEN_103560-1 [Araneus ventricosus]
MSGLTSLRTTVTRAFQLLGTFSPDCHKYLPALTATDCHLGMTSALEQLGITRESAPALSSLARWETSPRWNRTFSVHRPQRVNCSQANCSISLYVSPATRG